MPHVETEFSSAIRLARAGAQLSAGSINRTIIGISGIPGADRLPNALRILLENVVRNAGSDEEAERFARAVIDAGLAGASGDEISFMPARVLFQDFTGVPVFVDFAAMRDEAAKRGADPALVNPGIPCTLIIDHSVIADHA